MTPLAAYLLLFTAVGVGFIFVHLLAGKLIRPSRPDAEKGTIYECGEPTIGSAWIQFDLRFYVVALLFVIFDVEVAFFFPWAEVFGKANAIAKTEKPTTAAEYHAYADRVLDLAVPPASEQQRRERRRYVDMRELTDKDLKKQEIEQAAVKIKVEKKEKLNALEQVAERYDGALKKDEFEKNRADAKELSVLAFYEILLFFGILLVGFAYLWRRGDLAWVRSTAAEQLPPPAEAPPPPVEEPARRGPAVVGRY